MVSLSNATDLKMVTTEMPVTNESVVTYNTVTVSIGSSLSKSLCVCNKRRSGGLTGVRGAM